MSETLLVTGASGQLGRLVLDDLLASGKIAAGSIIATTRDVAKLADYAEKGVTVCKADFDDAASLETAFAGADKVLIISTDALDEPGKRLRQHQTAVAAAKTAGVSHLFYTSMPQPDDSLIPFAPDHLGTEQAIKESGLAYTIFRDGWYMENLFMSVPQALAGGKWYTSTGQGRIAHISRADTAAAIAGALLADDVANRTFTLTGAESHTTDEIAAAIRTATGKPLEVIHVTDEQLAGGMKAAGVPEFLIPLLVSFDANTREGKIAMVTGDAEALSGRKPMSLEAFLAGNSAALAG